MTERIPHSRPTLDAENAQAVSKAVQSGFVGSGEKVKEFENRVAALIGRKGGVALSSGSAAVHLGLLALGLGPGDQVLLPGFLCRAVLNVVVSVGAEPVLVDIEPTDFTMSLAAARRALTSKTKLILLPHMFGAPADVDGFINLGMPILEDAASSLGAIYSGRCVGGFGALSILSFGSTKVITTGQGGMALTDDPNVLERLRRLQNYDAEAPASAHYEVAYNYQFSDLQAALGLSQLQALSKFLQRRRQIAARYREALQGLPGVQLPEARRGAEHSYYRFIIRLSGDSGKVIAELSAAGIDARGSVAHFLYHYLGGAADNFPGCGAIRHSLISLPIYPSLNDTQVDFIAETCRQCLTRSAADEN